MAQRAWHRNEPIERPSGLPVGFFYAPFVQGHYMSVASTPPVGTRSEVLQEYVDSRGTEVRLDRPASMLQGVKLLGLASSNGRQYYESALRDAIQLYEGAKVNVNHPQGDPLSPRDYRDRIGVIRGVQLRAGEGLFGSLHYNPKHPLAEQLAWDAQHAPQNVGFSHNVLARTRRQGTSVVVEAIDRVQSVDLVADPATTCGLFEDAQSPQSVALRTWDQLSIQQLKQYRPDLLSQLTESHQQELNRHKQQLDDLAARQAATLRRERIWQLLTEHGLPLPGGNEPTSSSIVSETFLASLEAAADDKQLEKLVVDRAELVRETSATSGPIVAREQQLAIEQPQPSAHDTPDFVEAITGK